MIQIYKNYYLDADAYSFQLRRKTNEIKKGKPVYDIVGYVSSIDGVYRLLIRELERRELCEKEVKTFEEFAKGLEEPLAVLTETFRRLETLNRGDIASEVDESE